MTRLKPIRFSFWGIKHEYFRVSTFGGFMKSVLKAVVMLFVSVQAFAITELKQEQMVNNIEKLKSDIASECSPEVSQFALSKVISGHCPKTEKYLQMQFCNRKKDLVLFLQGVMTSSNIAEVTKRFGEVPPADALGGVLLYQMRNSIDQINETWSRQVKNIPAKCVTGNLKSQMRSYNSALREELGQTRLFINPPVQ